MSVFSALVVAFTLPPLIRQPFGLPPSPRGKALVRWNLVGAEGNSRGRRGQPAPYARVHSFPKIIERYRTG